MHNYMPAAADEHWTLPVPREAQYISRRRVSQKYPQDGPEMLSAGLTLRTGQDRTGQRQQGRNCLLPFTRVTGTPRSQLRDRTLQ